MCLVRSSLNWIEGICALVNNGQAGDIAFGCRGLSELVPAHGLAGAAKTWAMI